MSKSGTSTRNILFSCRAPDAEHVYLAGTFNDWKPDATAMQKTDDGNWNVELELPQGRYEFKFVVDRQWCCDVECHANAENPKCVPNEFGTMNRVCEVA